METTFSGRRSLRLIDEVQSAGYHVRLVYVGLESADLAVARVRQRAAAGGHSVPTEEVVRRYGRSLENLEAAIGRVDRAAVYDNSGPGAARRVLRTEQGRVVEARAVPAWLKHTLDGPVAPGRVLGSGSKRGQ